MNSEWQKVKLKDVVEINPKESIKKGTFLKKIAMDKLKPFCRDITDYEVTEFNGGSKFRNEDIIMASITPCLENGKIAKVNILDENEVGFGSTEYIIFRAIDGITNADFIYYLICSDIVREPAIKSMVGTSGRQRVQKDVVANLKINLPSYDEQSKIAAILKSLDDKIELNNQINKNLEQQAQAIFKSWFIDFEPFGGVMPDDWNTVFLSDIVEITSGKRPIKNQKIFSSDFQIPIVGATSITGYTNSILYNEKILVIGRVGTNGIVQRFSSPCWTSDNTLVIKTQYYEYIYQILHLIDYKNLNRGSTQPLITQSDLNKIKVIYPSKNFILDFENLIGSLMTLYENNINENKKLVYIRDTLLPKLMSDEIDVSAVEI